MKVWSGAPSPSSHASRPSLTRWLLLFFILLAFARLVWRWDLKSLWWDESLSLQRAESPLPALLLGRFSFDDGFTVATSTDQHPFAYFLLLGGLIRVAGESDLVLRFPSAAAATLLVPAAWAMARLLARRRIVPPATPLWAAAFMALNPFLLWYGREARMYSLVPLLALVSTYWLLRWTGAPHGKRARLYLAAYAIALVTLLCTHFLSFLILPVHAAVIFFRLGTENRRRAALAALAVLAAALVIGLASAVWVLHGTGGGANFSRVSLPMLAADLLNAFSLGLSVDIGQVRWLDYTFGVVAIVGALWVLRRRPIAPEGWLLPAWVIVPVLELDIIQRIQPAYMNARHMSLIGAAFVLLVAAGCAAVWEQRRWAGALLGTLLVAGMAYSTVNYFTLSQYAKDNFAQVGADLAAEMQPGDGVVLLPAHMIELYQHYLPLDTLETATSERTGSSLRGWAALPKLTEPYGSTEAVLKDMLQKYRRVWLVASGMVPLSPYQDETRNWLSSHAFLARDLQYESNTLLWLKLYLPQAPILPELPSDLQHRVTAAFGDKIRLDGYQIGEPLTSASSTPVTLYWQPLQKIDRRYKYILRLVSQEQDGSLRTLSTTEQEPYKGLMPTIWWAPGAEIFEYTGLPRPAPFEGAPASLRLAIQMYDAETLEKLPVTGTPEGGALADQYTVLMPFER